MAEAAKGGGVGQPGGISVFCCCKNGARLVERTRSQSRLRLLIKHARPFATCTFAPTALPHPPWWMVTGVGGPAIAVDFMNPPPCCRPRARPPPPCTRGTLRRLRRRCSPAARAWGVNANAHQWRVKGTAAAIDATAKPAICVLRGNKKKVSPLAIYPTPTRARTKK
jgi:hypothetical protein